MAENEGTEVKQRVKKGHPQKLWKRAQKTENRKKRREEKEANKHKYWWDLARTCEIFVRRHWVLVGVGAFVFVLFVALYNVQEVDNQRLPRFTDKVTIEFTQNTTSLGSITIGLFGQLCPKTVTNFIMLATHEKGYGYKGTHLYYVQPGHLIVGGDVENDDGTGGKSALKKPFVNENFDVSHAGPGYIGMLSVGTGHGISRRMSQFYITLAPMRNLDGKSVVFGKIMKGMEVLEKISETKVDKENAPQPRILLRRLDHSPA